MEIHTVSHYGQVYYLPHLTDKLCISYLHVLTTHSTNETQLGV